MPVGRVGFDGPGAGGAATSSAVLGDLIAVARGAGLDLGAATARAARRHGDGVAPRRPASVLDDRERHPVSDR